MYGNATYVCYDMPDNIVIILRLSDSEIGDLTNCDVRLTVIACNSPFWLRYLLDSPDKCVLCPFANDLSAGHSASVGC